MTFEIIEEKQPVLIHDWSEILTTYNKKLSELIDALNEKKYKKALDIEIRMNDDFELLIDWTALKVIVNEQN